MRRVLIYILCVCTLLCVGIVLDSLSTTTKALIAMWSCIVFGVALLMGGVYHMVLALAKPKPIPPGMERVRCDEHTCTPNAYIIVPQGQREVRIDADGHVCTDDKYVCTYEIYEGADGRPWATIGS